MAGFPTLLGVFFAEFHTVQGPRLAYQTPDGLLSSETFDAVSEYLIPKPQLCGRLVTLTTDREQIMSLPVGIESNRYQRNMLLFNLGFVFALEDDLRSYEPLVRKTARLLRSLEVERGLLSTQTHTAWMDQALPQLVQDLNRIHECQIVVREGAGDYPIELVLKLMPVYSEPPPVFDFEVPLLTMDLADLANADWDLTVRRILIFLDGVNHVKRIALLADVDVYLVRECLQNLLYYGAVQMVDIFQFGNVYSLSDTIHAFYANGALQQECLDYVRINEDPSGKAVAWRKSSSASDRDRPTPAIVFDAFARFRHGLTVAAVASDGKLAEANIDVRRLVVFGVARKILRRIHKFVVPRSNVYPQGTDDQRAVALYRSGTLSQNVFGERLQRLPRCYDELCVATGMTPSELDAVVAGDPRVRVTRPP